LEVTAPHAASTGLDDPRPRRFPSGFGHRYRATTQQPGDRELTVQTLAWLYREARRRKVFRTAALYVVGAWITLQVADVLFPGFGIPDAAIAVLVWTAVLGFPVALVFGWLFELGPGGIRRTASSDAGEHVETLPLARRDYLLLSALAAIAAVLAFRAVQNIREAPSEAAVGTIEELGGNVARLANSVAVLPFANISSDPENDYFCDGISEEILNEMSAVRQLNVIGRTSSFAFKGSNAGIEKISAVLGVQYVLQGSVRKAGRQLRISAQLLDQRGRQVWTQTFDRELANVFDIQEEIAQAVAGMVAQEVVARPGLAEHPNLEAYDYYLAGREFLHQRDIRSALEKLARAIELDPGFAEAHAEWAIARLMQGPTKDQLAAADAAIERSLELKPALLRAQVARAFRLLQGDPPDPGGTESVLRAVLEQDPNMSDALLWLSSALGQQNRIDESVEMLQRAHRIDPLHPSIASSLAQGLLDQGRDEDAQKVFESILQAPKPSPSGLLSVAAHYFQAGDLVKFNSVAKMIALHRFNGYVNLGESYAMFGDFSTAEYWMERSTRDDPGWERSRYNRQFPAQWRGDMELARQLLEQGLKSEGLRIEDEARRVQVYYASLLARSGHYSAAIGVLEPLAIGEPAIGALTVFLEPFANGWHALAWSYLRTGADAKANRILSVLAEACRAELTDDRWRTYSDVLHFCAENALLMGDAAQALALLERAIDTGWRDYYRRRNDPLWAALAGDPRYVALMTRVREDVDRQRAEVERIDATDDFKARLDAAVAARRGSDKSSEVSGR
jgi:TolB-like protein/Flp pilus assembly protein TadD